jgi:hypothetical protein
MVSTRGACWRSWPALRVATRGARDHLTASPRGSRGAGSGGEIPREGHCQAKQDSAEDHEPDLAAILLSVNLLRLSTVNLVTSLLRCQEVAYLADKLGVLVRHGAQYKPPPSIAHCSSGRAHRQHFSRSLRPPEWRYLVRQVRKSRKCDRCRSA